MQQLRKILQSAGFQQSALMVIGNTGATGLSAIAIILISRLMGPVRFGEFSVGFAILLILNRLNDVGLNAAILKFTGQAKSHDDFNRIFWSTLRLKLFLSIVLLVVGVVLTPFLANLLHFQNVTIIYLSIVLSVSSTLYEHLQTMLQAMHRFPQVVLINVIQSSAKLGGIAVFYLLGMAVSVPVFSWYMLAPILPVLLWRWLVPDWVSLNWQKLQQAKQDPRLLDMAKHAAVGFISAGIIENVDLLFVQGFLTPYETGLLSGVSRIATMLLLVAYSLGNVLNPRVSRYHQVADLQAYLRKAVLLSLLSVAGFVASLPFMTLLIRFSIGAEYLPGLPILAILLAGSFLTIATIPFLALFYVFKADWYFSVSGILQVLIIVIGNGWFVPHYGLAAAAWTKLVARLFLFVFTTGVALWYYRKAVRSAHS